MNTTTMYGIKNCDTVKKARAWLDAKKIQYAFHDYKTAGIEKPLLERWVKEHGWETICNRAGTTFKKLPDASKVNLTEKKVMDLMMAQPSMIKRPIVERSGKSIVGFSPDAYAKIFALVLLCLVSGASVLAQMRPGAKVEKTYGVGLPRDMDKLLIPDADYPVYPLKPGQEAYADVDGMRIKEDIKKITSFSLRSLDAGELYWGRIPGSPYHQMGMDFLAAEWGKLGLTVRREPVDLPPLWYPTKLTASYRSGAQTAPLQTMFPIDGTKPTPAGGITADLVWVGVGAAPDLIGRDLRGKAVLVYSTFVPGGRSHSASDRAGIFNSNTLITRAGAALIVNVMAVPGNGQFNPEGAPEGPDAVPTLTISQDEGFMLRDRLAAGERVQLSVALDIEERTGLKTGNVYAVLPGASDEQILIMAHCDGFFQGAMDNASGMATGVEIARHYARIPQAQRPRTLVFLATPDHHHGEHGRALVIKNYDWSKVALILNLEHTSQTLLYMYNQDLVTANAISARRWYASGSPAFQQLVKRTFKDFNVSVYTSPERNAGGSLGALTSYAPAFHIIDHVIYHTTLDTPELVPAVGLTYSARAFLSVLDHANRMTRTELRGPDRLPNPIR